jgi:Flp pilus assembly pilin Flp
MTQWKQSMKSWLTRLAAEDEGLELLEYAILAVVLAVALAAAYNILGTQIGDALTQAGSTLSSGGGQ